jgi:hypothetical protein
MGPVMSARGDHEDSSWLATAFGDERQYGGNQGYVDDVSRVYSYDSNVPNHRRVRAGDLLVIRDRSHVLAVARIAEIAAEPGSKPL